MTTKVQPLTKEEETFLAGLEREATEGPWLSLEASVRSTAPDLKTGRYVIEAHGAQGNPNRRADMAFIAAAREAVPRLLATLDAARAELAGVKAECDNYEADFIKTQEFMAEAFDQMGDDSLVPALVRIRDDLDNWQNNHNEAVRRAEAAERALAEAQEGRLEAHLARERAEAKLKEVERESEGRRLSLVHP